MWPAVRAIWCQPKCFNALADYLTSLPESAAAVAKTTNTLGDIPLVVLVAGARHAHLHTEDEAVANLSSHGKLLAAPDSGHWIQLDRPDLVVEAIREVVFTARERVREPSPGSPSQT